ncbi:MAG: lysine transporter LysE [Aequorivita sp.]|jgi:threonine/homoserine/homoserine lactone efflux protein|nr:lysine transporter LysE [Aequorivita sp.]MAO49122.1 lysine transporter LysE [Aequorivita sp.]MBF31573.1 lysine transporter LysE [Aequorivita sp.]HAV54452.1 lysine transporter LysE [Aequorivita sp.]HBL80491.1 lysine transporter LysE [Aequorivita sp.]|tara:strand:- start:19982 stop:20608 length:627 start_codon:yes stop_codon:yes gene_type:complete
MAIIYNLLVGFFGSFIGVLPPGLINMYAAKISMREGRKRGLLFSIGVCIIVMLQTYIALLFARYIGKHPEIVSMLQKVALGIFISLTIYFIFIAKDTRREIRDHGENSKKNRFFLGMFIAMLNLLPLPYWMYLSITFAAFGAFSFTEPELFFAVVASGIGTFSSLALYVQFFRPKEHAPKLKLNMNYVIGIITALISIITFIKILREI